MIEVFGGSSSGSEKPTSDANFQKERKRAMADYEGLATNKVDSHKGENNLILFFSNEARDQLLSEYKLVTGFTLDKATIDNKSQSFANKYLTKFSEVYEASTLALDSQISLNDEKIPQLLVSFFPEVLDEDLKNTVINELKTEFPGKENFSIKTILAKTILVATRLFLAKKYSKKVEDLKDGFDALDDSKKQSVLNLFKIYGIDVPELEDGVDFPKLFEGIFKIVMFGKLGEFDQEDDIGREKFIVEFVKKYADILGLGEVDVRKNFDLAYAAYKTKFTHYEIEWNAKEQGYEEVLDVLIGGNFDDLFKEEEEEEEKEEEKEEEVDLIAYFSTSDTPEYSSEIMSDIGYVNENAPAYLKNIIKDPNQTKIERDGDRTYFVFENIEATLVIQRISDVEVKMSLRFGKGTKDDKEEILKSLNNVERHIDAENSRKFLKDFKLSQYFGDGDNALNHMVEFVHFFTSKSLANIKATQTKRLDEDKSFFSRENSRVYFTKLFRGIFDIDEGRDFEITKGMLAEKGMLDNNGMMKSVDELRDLSSIVDSKNKVDKLISPDKA